MDKWFRQVKLRSNSFDLGTVLVILYGIFYSPPADCTLCARALCAGRVGAVPPRFCTAGTDCEILRIIVVLVILGSSRGFACVNSRI